MDRFIALLNSNVWVDFAYLKSSMDRFIVSSAFIFAFLKIYLKSSMDRFIVMSKISDQSTEVI